MYYIVKSWGTILDLKNLNMYYYIILLFSNYSDILYHIHIQELKCSVMDNSIHHSINNKKKLIS